MFQLTFEALNFPAQFEDEIFLSHEEGTKVRDTQYIQIFLRQPPH